MRISNINNYHIFNNSYKPNQNTQTRFVTFSAKDTFKKESKKYINPVTNQYDKKIEKMEKDLFKRCGGVSYKLVKVGIDASTGEYSPYFKKLMSYCYPSSMDKLFSRYREDLGKKIYNRSDNNRLIPDLVIAMKNKNGDITKENYEFVEKALLNDYKAHGININRIINLLNTIKNEDGTINDRRKKVVEEQYIKRGINPKAVEKNLYFLERFPEEKQDEIFETIMQQRPHNNTIEWDSDFVIRAEFCFDKEGNPIEENIKILNEIDSKRYIIYDSADKDVPTLCKNSQDFKEVFLKGITYEENVFYQLANAIEEEMEEDGTIVPDKKALMLKTLPYNQDLSEFKTIYDIYSQQQNKEEYLKNLITFFELNNSPNLKTHFDDEEIIKLSANLLPDDCTSMKDKLILYKDLKIAYNFTMRSPNTSKYTFLKNSIDLLEKAIKITDLSLPITKEDKQQAINTIFKSNKYELTDFEKTIKKSIKTLERHKNGLPLSYTREAFIKDIKNLTEQNPNIQHTLNELGFTGSTPPECFYVDALKINKNDDKKTKQVKNLINKFLYENEITTGNKELDKQLNTIIKAFPEFVNMIGRKQHATHNYSLDIHTLLVLARIIKDEEYKTLNQSDKLTLKSVVLFHDMSKKEGEIDKTHPEVSAAAAKSILSKIYSNKDQLERVYNLIKHHNFLEEYDNSQKKDITARNYGIIFRRPSDFKLAKMLTEADLKSVNEDFYNQHQDKLSKNYLLDITGRINDYQQTGNAIFPTYITNLTKTNKHKETIKGREYTVINTHNINNKEDLSNYGFESGIKKKNLRFLVHMTDSLETIKILDKSNEDVILSESFISLDHQRTYENRKYGVVLKQKNYDIVSTHMHNQASGTQKDLDDIRILMQHSARNEFKMRLFTLLELKLQKVELKDYQKFYNDVLSNITSLKQINPEKIYNIGDKKFSGEELIDILKKCQDSLLSTTNKHHNEIVGLSPEIQAVIAKEKNPNNLPEKLLDFAHENNYPIILI